MATFPFPTWVEVNLTAVEENVRYLCGDLGVPMMVVVKADAYGHGAVEVTRTALAAGAEWAAVARYGEAHILRCASIDAPVLVFGGVMPEEIDHAIQEQVSLTLHSFESAQMMAARAEEMGRMVKVHLKVDTGMGRMGVLPQDALALARMAWESGWIDLEGVYSHFSMADDENPHPLTTLQIERFQAVIHSLEEAGIQPRWQHLANTSAALDVPESRHNMVRIGSGVIGMRPSSYGPLPPEIRRSLTWKTTIVSCKRLPAGWGVSYGQTYITPRAEYIAVLPLGYADGFRRSANNVVLIDGRRVKVVGRVCMDACMVALDRSYPPGTVVTVIGADGTDSILPEELAERWDTTEVDVTSAIAARVPRVYVRDGEKD